MTSEQPASEQMRDLAAAVVNIGRGLIQRIIDLQPEPDLMTFYEQAVESFNAQTEALYTRVQQEEQQLVTARALLEAWETFGRRIPNYVAALPGGTKLTNETRAFLFLEKHT